MTSLISDAALSAAKKKLSSLKKSWSSKGGVAYGTVLKTDASEFVAGHTACHSWITYAYSSSYHGQTYAARNWSSAPTNKNVHDFLVLSCVQVRGCTQEAFDAYLGWLVKESPFSGFILNGDDDDSLKDGVILFCGPNGLSQAQAMWICKSLRYAIEGGKALDVWQTLHEGGVNPFFALMVATFVRSVKGTTFDYTGKDGHSSVFGDYLRSKPDVVGVAAGNVVRDADGTAQLFVRPEGWSPPAKTKTREDIEGYLQSLCKPFTKDDGWGGKVQGKGIEKDELIRRVLEWQNSFGVGYVPPQVVPQPLNADFPKKAKPKPKPMPTSSTVYLELDL